MKKVIEKIEKIKGVEKVTKTGSNELTVQVEYKWVAKISNIEQWNFTWLKTKGYIPTDVSFLGHANSNGGVYDVIDIEGKSTQCEKYFTKINYTVIPFSEYLSEYNLKDEWEKYLIGEAEKRYPVGTKYKSCAGYGNKIVKEKFIYNHGNEGFRYITDGWGGQVYRDGKWATIIEPELELVSGEIYLSEEDNKRWIFRFKSNREPDAIRVNYLSIILYDDIFNVDSFLCHKDSTRLCKPATNKQKAKLIKAELKNGYLWNGKELVKYK